MPSKYSTADAQIGDIMISYPSHVVSHCGIMVKNWDGVSPSKIAFHATSNAGMVVSDVGTWKWTGNVYRPRDLKGDLQDRLTKIAEKIKASGTQYGHNRAWTSGVFGSSTFGSGARERLLKYRQRLTENQGVVKNVYCSELVILVYQLACAGENDRHFVALDAKHSLPKTLRTYLLSNPTYWEETAYEARADI